MTCEMHLLVDLRRQCQDMTRAVSSAPRKLTWADCLVVQFEEVVVTPTSRVIVDHSHIHLSVVVFELHEDFTIVLVVLEVSLSLELVSPEITVVTPTTSEIVTPVRVSDSDESNAIAQCDNT
jgi:hypothetical protein